MEVISNRDDGEACHESTLAVDLELVVIGEWMEEYIWRRDKGICQVCEQSAQTERNPLVVERKDLSLPSRAANLWLVHYDCHEEYQSQRRCEALRLEPQDVVVRPQPKRPRYWTWKRVLALLVLLVDLALCYSCILFYKWCFRVFWP